MTQSVVSASLREKTVENSTFRLLSYRIPTVSIEMDDTFPTGEEKLQFTVKPEYAVDPKNTRRASVRLVVGATSESGRFKGLVEIRGVFEADEAMIDEVFSALCNVNGPAILYPYARALFSTITAQSGVRPMILPVVNFQGTKQGPRE